MPGVTSRSCQAPRSWRSSGAIRRLPASSTAEGSASVDLFSLSSLLGADLTLDPLPDRAIDIVLDAIEGGFEYLLDELLFARIEQPRCGNHAHLLVFTARLQQFPCEAEIFVHGGKMRDELLFPFRARGSPLRIRRLQAAE